MKRFFALAALVLGMVSCQTEPEGFDVIVGGEQDVTINVTIPETETRATAGSNSAVSAFSDLIATDTYVARYIFEVYYEGNMIERQVKYVDAESTSFRVRLIPERDYQFVVWTDIVVAEGAQDGIVSNNLHYVIGDTLQDITLNNTWVAMDESRDAFTATYPALNFNGAQSINIELVRPLAKLRVVTTDCDDILSLYNLTATRATVQYTTEHRTAFNAFTGKAAEADGTKTHTYEIATYGNENDTRRTIFTDYFFAENDVVNFIFTVYDNNGEKIKMTNFNTPINVRRNYLTTLEGNVLTDGNDIGITVNPGFGNNGENVENYTVITSASELLAVMNTDGEYVVGNNIVITANAAATSAVTRADAAPKTTIINLNGYTITVENKTNEALATIEEGNKLVFEGEGVIELTNDSTAPFIENTDGVVIIEEATLTTNSSSANIVDGSAIVNDGANVDENAISGETTSQLDYVLANGGEVTLLQDVTSDKVLEISATNPVVINGANFTLTTNATRAIRVTPSKANVTINDLNIVVATERVYPNDVRGISLDAGLNGVDLTLNNCSVDFTHKTANDWAYAVNVSGNGTDNKVTVNGGTYNGANVVNAHSAKNTIVVKNATLTSLYPNNDTYYGACIWVLQNQGSTVYAEGNTFNGNNAVAFNLGTGTTLEEKDNTDNTKLLAAKVGNTYYYNVAKAINAAEDGATVTVLHNHACDVAATVAAGKTMTLDLNGKTITGRDSATGSFGLITNNGTLTVKNGTITLVAENNREWNAFSSVISNQPGGNLTVENVTLEHFGGTDMAYGIDNLTNGKGTYAETTVNNGAVVKSTYRAIRQFLNGIEAQNILTVNAGAVVEGANKSIWMQDPSAKANTGTLVVNQGATLCGDVYLFVTAGSTEWPVEVSIANAAFAEGSTVVTGNVPADYKVVEKNGVWTVVPNFNDNFAENTWENIIKACQNNSVPESWNVGDTKAMTIAGKEYQIRVLGKNHDTYTAGGTAPLTFQIAEAYGTAPMNATQTNTTGWSGSKMRTETMAEILEVMPVKDAIKAVDKETLNGTRDGLETTSDKLFLLSEVEVNGSVYFSNDFAEGSRYEFFTDVDSQIMNESYWLRGPGKNNAIGFTQINRSGYMANGSAEYACGVVFGFCF